MIFTLGYRGVFRQAQYETVIVEGSITVDDTVDVMPPAEIPEQCPACGSELLHPEPVCQDCGATTGEDEDEARP